MFPLVVLLRLPLLVVQCLGHADIALHQLLGFSELRLQSCVGEFQLPQSFEHLSIMLSTTDFIFSRCRRSILSGPVRCEIRTPALLACCEARRLVGARDKGRAVCMDVKTSMIAPTMWTLSVSIVHGVHAVISVALAVLVESVHRPPYHLTSFPPKLLSFFSRTSLLPYLLNTLSSLASFPLLPCLFLPLFASLTCNL